jgi:predicted Zn-dependent protease with MMP-like domain
MTLQELTLAAMDVVGKTQRKLPNEIRELAHRVPVHYEAGPGDEVLADGFPDDILGLFTGSPHGLEFEPANPELPQIFLYLENLREYAEDDLELFREEVRLTYLHELGHYFGWDEDELTKRGLD